MHLLSFADRRYRGSLARIRGEARSLGTFASVRAVDDRWLASDYWRRHAETVRRHPRGFGLWTWKPYAIRRVLGEIPAGDFLVYIDAGCSLNAEGRERLEEYLQMAADHPSGMLAFTLDSRVGEWTKRAALAAWGGDDAATRGLPMVAAGVLAIRAVPAAAEFVAEWDRRMEAVHLVDDSPSPGGEHPDFRGHRHDQSVFTLLAHQRGVQRMPDETWWPEAWDSSRRYPIHARRWRHRLPWSQAWMRAGRRPHW